MEGERTGESSPTLGDTSLYPTEVVEPGVESYVTPEGERRTRFLSIFASTRVPVGQLGIALESEARILHEVSDPPATERNNAQPTATSPYFMLDPVAVSEKRRRAVGAVIARFRKERGQGPVAFAAAVGVNRTTLWHIERGDYLPRDATLGAIARELGVSPFDLDPGGEDEHGNHRSKDRQG